jgi:hypothetical protein
MLSHLILSLLDTGAPLLPINGKVPAIKRWRAGASRDPSVLEDYRRQFGSHIGFGWALTLGIVVTDSDESHGQHGLLDFQRLDGRNPREVETPTATSPTGGLHHYWATGGHAYRNVRLPGTAVDIKTVGGFVAVPDVIDNIGNGRTWLRAPWDMPMALAPPWVDAALRQEPTRSPTETPDLPPSESDRDFAREALARACARIAFAPGGTQDSTRHRECFFIGLQVARGAIDRDEALAALVRAALAMPTYGLPWRDLERRVEKSLAAGENHAEVAS